MAKSSDDSVSDQEGSTANIYSSSGLPTTSTAGSSPSGTVHNAILDILK